MLQRNTHAAPRVRPAIQVVPTDDEAESDDESEAEGDCTVQFVLNTNLVVELCLRQSQGAGQHKGNSKRSSSKGGPRKPSGGRKWKKKGFSSKSSNSSKGGASTGQKVNSASSRKGSGAIRPMTGKNRF